MATLAMKGNKNQPSRALLLFPVALMACAQLLDVGRLRERVDASADVGTIDGSTDDGGGDAACPPNKFGGTCSTFPQCGCPDGDNCEVTDPGGRTSCTQAGTIPLWGNCNGFGVCEKGAECIGNACKPFCGDASDCVGNNVTCEQIKSGTYDVPGLKVCSSGCDPHDPGAICGPGVTCNPAPWDGLGKDHGDCYGGAGTGVGPDACANNQTLDCAPGYYCTTDNKCIPWCRVGHDADCPDGSTCQNFSTPPVLDGVTYGLCE